MAGMKSKQKALKAGLQVIILSQAKEQVQHLKRIHPLRHLIRKRTSFMMERILEKALLPLLVLQKEEQKELLIKLFVRKVTGTR